MRLGEKHRTFEGEPIEFDTVGGRTTAIVPSCQKKSGSKDEKPSLKRTKSDSEVVKRSRKVKKEVEGDGDSVEVDDEKDGDFGGKAKKNSRKRKISEMAPEIVSNEKTIQKEEALEENGSKRATKRARRGSH